MSDMSDRDRIEEAHGLWELEVARLCAFVEIGAGVAQLADASDRANAAFDHWQKVSKAVTGNG